MHVGLIALGFVQSFAYLPQKENSSWYPIFYGGGFPRAMQGIDLLHDLQKAAIYCKWVAVAALPDDFKDVQRDETKKNPEASLLAYLYCACEDFILSHWLEFLQKTLTPKHLSLHFDGVRVAAMHNIDVDDICRQCEHHIAEEDWLSRTHPKRRSTGTF